MAYARMQEPGVITGGTQGRGGDGPDGPTTDGAAEDASSANLREALDDAVIATRFRMGMDIRVAVEGEALPRVRVSEPAIRRLFCAFFGRVFAEGTDRTLSVQLRRSSDVVAVEFGLPPPELTRSELGEWTRTCEEIGARLEYGTAPAGATLRLEMLCAPDSPLPERPRRATLGLDPMRVLLVDDDDLIRSSVARLLARHHVEAVGDGERAIVRALAEEFDIILCDLMMPGTSGMDVYRRICAVRPELGPRFIFISGGANTAAAEAFLAEPGRERLDKPFGGEALREAILRRRPVG